MNYEKSHSLTPLFSDPTNYKNGLFPLCATKGVCFIQTAQLQLPQHHHSILTQALLLESLLHSLPVQKSS